MSLLFLTHNGTLVQQQRKKVLVVKKEEVPLLPLLRLPSFLLGQFGRESKACRGVSFCRLDISFDEELLSRIESGLPTGFDFEFNLGKEQRRWWWFDRTVDGLHLP